MLTQTEVSQLYVSIFGRVSEKEGNEFWQSVSYDKTKAEIADWMLATADAQEYFGDTLNDNRAFIEFIYENTFGKTYQEDPEGVNFWVNALESGQYSTKGEVIAALIYAATQPENSGPAQDQFIHRTMLSDRVSTLIEEAPSDYKEVLGFYSKGNPNGNLYVDSSPSTVDEAMEKLNPIIISYDSNQDYTGNSDSSDTSREENSDNKDNDQDYIITGSDDGYYDDSTERNGNYKDNDQDYTITGSDDGYYDDSTEENRNYKDDQNYKEDRDTNTDIKNNDETKSDESNQKVLLKDNKANLDLNNILSKEDKSKSILKGEAEESKDKIDNRLSEKDEVLKRKPLENDNEKKDSSKQDDNQEMTYASDDDYYDDGEEENFDENSGNGELEIIGSSGDDTLIGDIGDDIIIAFEGDDILVGGEGDDYLDGYSGDDILIGSEGNDVLIGGDGIDFLSGESGYNILSGDDLDSYQRYSDTFYIKTNREGMDFVIDFDNSTVKDYLYFSNEELNIDFSKGYYFIKVEDLTNYSNDLEQAFILDLSSGNLYLDYSYGSIVTLVNLVAGSGTLSDMTAEQIQIF